MSATFGPFSFSFNFSGSLYFLDSMHLAMLSILSGSDRIVEVSVMSNALCFDLSFGQKNIVF